MTDIAADGSLLWKRERFGHHRYSRESVALTS